MFGSISPSCHSLDDETYLTSEQLLHFKGRLLSWRSELLVKLREGSEETVNEGLPDWVDTASASMQVELSMVARERSVLLIQQIDAALGRMVSGTYGYCAETGEEIGLERLMALPTARYTVEAQQDIERRNRRFR